MASEENSHYLFNGLGDAQPKRRKLEDELKNRYPTPEEVKKAEVSFGLSPSSRSAKQVEFKYKTKVFDPEQPEDKKALEELLNSQKYHIFSWKDNWTPVGSFRIFVVYGEVKQPENDNEQKS